MILYHGSNNIIKEPDLKYSSNKRDFGKGFYLTSDKNQACQWAKKKTLKIGSGSAVINIFNIEDDMLRQLNIKTFKSANSEWFRFVLKNRITETTEEIKYDLIIGPVANDGTFETIGLYNRKQIDEQTAIAALKTQKLKDQYVFKTNKALSFLKYEGSEEL